MTTTTTSMTTTAAGWAAAGELPADSLTWQLVTMAALPGGRALIAGGRRADASVSDGSAVFDPATSTWTAAPPMNHGRHAHTLTRLATGPVLAAGGFDGPQRFPPPTSATTERYDPAAGTWTPAAPMGEPRFGHAATLLRDGRVLVSGGENTRDATSTKTLRSAELYDPVTDTWSAAAPMTDARNAHHSVLLDDGRVLVVGGSLTAGRGQTPALAFCEVYDPDAGTWTPTGSLGAPRCTHRTTKLADGTVLTTGGWHSEVADGAVFDAHSLATAERYDPATGRWTPTRPMPSGRCFHEAALLADGTVLVIGGTDDATLDAGYRSVVRYHPLTGTWTAAPGLLTGRYGFGALSLDDGRVLVAAGVSRAGDGGRFDGDNQIAATAELFGP